METTDSPTPTKADKPKLNFSLDLRYVALALLAIIVAMLLLWKPWQASADANARTVSVTGEATIKATPDEYAFNPSYEFKTADKAAGIKAAADKQTEVVAKLKALGVDDKNIKTSVNGYENYQPNAVDSPESGVSIAPSRPTTSGYVYNLQLTVTVPTREEAQKVQDYLVTTTPGGSVTPYPQFSEGLRTKLESQARDKATKDARTKADQSAENLGFKVGSVKSVDDGTGFNGGIMPMRGAEIMSSDASAKSSISVQPGENDLSYSVTVVYYIK